MNVDFLTHYIKSGIKKVNTNQSNNTFETTGDIFFYKRLANFIPESTVKS